MARMFINPLHILRSLQLVNSFIVLGLDAYVASWYNSSEFLIPCPPSIAFLIFTAAFTILIILPYTTFAPRYFPKIAHKWAMLCAETTTCLFWFAGFVATASFIHRLAVCRGTVCHSAITATIFGAFQFALFAASSYFAIRHVSLAPVKDTESARTNSIKMHRRWLGREKGAERI